MLIFCPFCSYSPSHITDRTLADDDLAYHVEIFHPEGGNGESPFRVKTEIVPSMQASRQSGRNRPAGRPAASNYEPSRPVPSREYIENTDSNEDDEYLNCPKDCGEKILRTELEQHISLHLAEDVALEDLEGVQEDLHHAIPSHRTIHDHIGPAASHDIEKDDAGPAKRLLKGFLHRVKNRPQNTSDQSLPKACQRLGRKELGPHAYEDRMPSWLHRQLERGPAITWMDQIGPDGRISRLERVANETPGLIPHLSRLLKQDPSVSKAWLCSPGVKHIFKMHREGGFCGYRNIQMQASWMQHNKYPGYDHFSDSTPNILYLQEMIENAWDKGYNSSGRIETGGILGTRKFIGTPEAQALFQSIQINCHARAITKSNLGDRRMSVHRLLLEEIADYFAGDACEPSDKVYMTKLPPIYFQHPGHSLTVVGFEIHKDGEVNLLVFDPMFETSPAVIRYMASPSRIFAAEKILRPFRRGDLYLKRYKSFEILHLALIEG